MKRFAILIVCGFIFCNSLMAQSKKSEYYKLVNIDSLLQSPIILPKNRQFIVKKVKFSISTDEIVDMGKVGGVIRDRFIQFNKLSPDQDWKYKFGCVYFKTKNKNLALVFSRPNQFDKMMKIDTSSLKEEMIIKAKMLIGDFKRYDITRDFLIQGIQVKK